MYLVMNPLRVVFMGTPAIGLPTLEALLADPTIEVVAVCCSPDKPVGRKQVLTAPPIKVRAMEHDIPVLQPTSLKGDDIYAQLASFEADYFVVIAYGFLIPERILALPKLLPLNIHGSLLPKYRGASPIQEALLQGDKETGITFMEMVKAMDAGAMVHKVSCPITPEETSGSLFEKLGHLAGTHICSVLHDYANGTLSLEAQSDNNATYCSKITKDMGIIDPKHTPAHAIYQRWQAYTPWPGISLLWKEEYLKLLQCHPISTPIPAGTFALDEQQRLLLGTSEGSLHITQLQRPGKKAMAAADAISGYGSWLGLG